MSDKGFFLINGDGKVLPGRAELSAVRAAWSRDGKRLLGVHRTESDSWSDIESVMSEAQRKYVVEKSKIAKPRMMAYTGDWKEFEILPEKNIPGGLLVAIVLYLRDNDAEGLPEKLGDKWKELSEVKPTIWHLQILDRDGDTLKSGRVLVRSLDEIIFPTASPDDKYVAYNSDSWGESGMGRSLFVVSADGGAVRVPAVNVAAGFDWSPDGQRLAYVRSSLIHNGIDEYLQLGSLATIRIRGDDGALLKEWETLEDRAGLLFNPFTIKWAQRRALLFGSRWK
ncbi:MAG: PD40 domain-containing protein [Planctomycetes bacterium]|nr:PD40 domain-containing protein [Planctomycetota bacterium]